MRPGHADACTLFRTYLTKSESLRFRVYILPEWPEFFGQGPLREVPVCDGKGRPVDPRRSTVDRRLFEKGQICRLPFVVPLNKSTAVRARAPPAPENRKSRLPKQESRKSWDDASRRPRFSRTSFRGPWVPHALGQAEGRPSTVERRRPTRRPPKVDQSTPNGHLTRGPRAKNKEISISTRCFDM